LEFAKYWVHRGIDTIEAMLEKIKGKYCFGDEITLAD
jgi:glutathione S-transferase